MIAVNAVMAGCRPEYMPVFIATLKALANSKMPHSLFTSTGVYAPLTIINGPMATELGVNSGVGLMGPGWQANACIGRAISLIFINGVGQSPGIESPSVISHPGKYTWCFAECETANPWEPLHVERGFAPEVSTVSLMSASGSQAIKVAVRDPSDILNFIICAIEGQQFDAVSPPRADQLLVLGPSDAGVLANGGWTKPDIKRYLSEHAHLGGPEYLQIVVAGGPGSHNSMYVPGQDTISTEEIDQYRPKNWDVLLREAEQARSEL